MKISLIVIAVIQLLIHFCVFSQEPLQVSVAVLESDNAARLNEVRTLSDEPCALVKVTTHITDIQFDSDNGIVKTIPREDGCWIYLRPGETIVRLMALGYPFKDIQLPEPTKEYLVYEMNISAARDPLLVSNINRITFRINENNVYIQHILYILWC